MPAKVELPPDWAVLITPAQAAALTQGLADVETVREWCRSHRISAINLTTKDGGRPQWAIAPEQFRADLERMTRENLAPEYIEKLRSAK